MTRMSPGCRAGARLWATLAFKIALLGVLQAVPAAWATPAPPVNRVPAERYTFVAYPAGDDTPRYTGSYEVYRDGPLVEEVHRYKTPAGEPVQVIRSVFDLEAMRPVSYESRSFRSGEHIEGRVVDGAMRYRITGRDGTIRSEGTSAWNERMYLWTNLAHVVRRNWQALGRGDGVDVELFVLDRHAAYPFTLRMTGAGTLDGRPVTRMELVPSSWLLRLVLPEPTFAFAANRPDLVLEYRGHSAVTDAEGHHERLRIVLDPVPTG